MKGNVPKTSKKFNAWDDERLKEVIDIMHSPTKEYLMGAWKGFKR
jgi:hypothetical protein